MDEEIDGLRDESMDSWRFCQWLRLRYYFQHEVEEGEITEQTYQTLTNALLAVKPE